MLPVAERTEAPRAAPTADVPERITMEELRELWSRGEPVILVDGRSDRTYRADSLRAAGAVRLPPEDAVRTARQLGLEQHATLVVYCA